MFALPAFAPATRTVEWAAHPRALARDLSLIDLTVKFKEFAQPVRFTASPADCMEYGRRLHAEALAGRFGEIEAPAGKERAEQ